MSKWDRVMAQAERIQKDLAFARAQIEGTMFGDMSSACGDIQKLLDRMENASEELVEVAESLEQTPRTVAIHRVKN